MNFVLPEPDSLPETAGQTFSKNKVFNHTKQFRQTDNILRFHKTVI